MKIINLIFLFCLISPTNASAVFTELSISHSYKKTTFTTDNYMESELLTGSVSFFIWDHIALESSYTKGLAMRKEKDPNYPVRTITQNTTVYGLDLVLSLSDRKATFQPFLKGGTAYISKKQVVSDEGNSPFEINPKSSLAPSYGLGFKILLSSTFAITTGIDMWQTPIDDGTKTNDVATRTGLSWIF